MSGLPTFSLVGDGKVPRRATRRERGNAALIRHRQREQRELSSGTHEVWLGLMKWRIAWENEILRYRDGNNGEDNE